MMKITNGERRLVAAIASHTRLGLKSAQSRLHHCTRQCLLGHPVPPAPQASPFSVAKRVGARVKAVREARGWTQEALASALTQAGHPISMVGVAKTESATRPVTIEDLAALAQALEVPITYLLPDDIADAGEDGTPRDRDE